jgi:DNA-binding CsgD family transcriptional regulator/PAS domain-containing protein
MRCFIHLVEGNGRTVDTTGMDFRNLHAAKLEAAERARDVLVGCALEQRAIAPDFRVEIADEEGLLLYALLLKDVAAEAVASDRYRRLYNVAPDPCLLVDPGMTIFEANPAYLSATHTSLGALSGLPMFQAFPDNPADPEATGVRNLMASFQFALRQRKPHTMPEQRYDIRRADGMWEKHYWNVINTPVLDRRGQVEFIAHKVEDVTGKVQSRNAFSRAATGDAAARVAKLSDRERQVFHAVVVGQSTREIAREHGLSPKTVEIYRSRAMLRLEVSTLPELVRLAVLAELSRANKE